jgi:hypothetical protein
VPWIAVYEDLEEGKWCAVTSETRIDDEDPNVGEDVHVIPVTVQGDDYRFGVHVMRRDCVCHPEIDVRVLRRTRVIHSEKVN